MSIGDRIEECLAAQGMSQAELARRVGVRQSTINALVRGQSRSSSHLHKIARELGTTTDFLAGESDDAAAGSKAAAGNVDPNIVEVEEIDLAYGMGGTFLDDNDVSSIKRTFPGDWLRRFTKTDPQHLFFARGVGDSMMPTISDSDTILVDRSQTHMTMGDQIWAVSFGGVGMIKRLRPRPDGTVTIMSDNPNVSDDRATDGELFLHGRVVAIMRNV